MHRVIKAKAVLCWKRSSFDWIRQNQIYHCEVSCILGAAKSYISSQYETGLPF